VGDVINVASRIEGANKELGTRTLISEATFAGLGGRLATRRIEELVELRGRQTRMVLHELLEVEHQPRLSAPASSRAGTGRWRPARPG
jgi:adenylate cyclase